MKKMVPLIVDREGIDCRLCKLPLKVGEKALYNKHHKTIRHQKCLRFKNTEPKQPTPKKEWPIKEAYVIFNRNKGLIEAGETYKSQRVAAGGRFQ